MLGLGRLTNIPWTMIGSRTMSTNSARPFSTIQEIILLRWVAVCGQLVTIGVVAYGVKIRLPLGVLFSIVGLTAISNLALHFLIRKRYDGDRLIFTILMVDICLFSGLLGFSGGVENPFASFYLVHLAIGAMVLRGIRLWSFLGLIALAFFLLFFWFRPLHAPFTHAGKISIGLHLQGTFISLFLTGFCVAWFMQKISRSLREREQALGQAELLATRQKQLMHLATLAGGVAHEMNTPLGTIALVAGELDQQLKKESVDDDIKEDIRLIRSEVDRCRNILDKLNDQSTRSLGAVPESLSSNLIPDLVLNNFPEKHKARIQFELPDAINDLLVPREPLIQSLTTLIKNGIEAAGNDPSPVFLKIAFDGDFVEFTITNPGPPIPEDIQSRMGEIFFSTKKQHEGMGLGLFLVRSFAESNGGQLRISSSADSDTKIVLRIPLICSLGEGNEFHG